MNEKLKEKILLAIANIYEICTITENINSELIFDIFRGKFKLRIRIDIIDLED